MKIYLVEKDNGESYEDYRTEIASAHTTYRNASQSLLDDGYFPFPYKNTMGEWDVRFILITIEGQPTPEEIEEMRKEDEVDGFFDEDYDFGYEMVYHAEIIEIELDEE